MSASRILIVRTSALGDVVHTMPLASALRRHRPTARIGWIVERRFAPLLRDHPAVDEVLEVALREWRERPFARATWRQLRLFLRRLEDFAPEIVIDAMGNHKAGVLAALTLADRRIGAARGDRREPSSALWISEPTPLAGDHVVDRTLSLLASLGIADRTVDFAADGILTGDPELGPTPPVLIHPGAGWRNKEYPPERWGDVATRLARAEGRGGRLRVGVLAGPGEDQLAATVAGAAEGAATVVPAAGLEALAARLRGARLVLAGDTGPLHLARALGTPVLCVLGPTDPRRNGAYGAADGNVCHRLPCSFCYQRFDEAKACLLAIEPATIARRALDLLAVT